MKISYILDSVDSGTIVLPEFQRGYVWTRDQVKGLIQSLYERFPVGGLLIWNTRADTTDLRGSDAGGADTVKLLLDGQQRVTSLYGVMRGKPPQFFEDPEKVKAFTGLHFHLQREAFEFYSPNKMADDPLWVSVTELMLAGPEELTERLSSAEGMDVKNLGVYINRLQRLHGIRDVDLHDENLSGDHMTVDVVVDIFNRVNSGGTKLSKGDLALARICAIRPAARDELRSTIEEWRAGGFEFALDWLLRCINVVVTGEARFEALKNVSAEDFGTGMKKAKQAVDFLLNLVSTRLGIDHDRVLIGRYGLPAMVRIVVDKGGSVTDQQLQNNLLFWYIHQGAWGRYSGSTESTLDRDLEAIETGGVEGLIRELELSRGTLEVRPEDFDTQTVGSRFYPILYLLTRVNDAQDLLTGMPLSANLLGKGSKLEVHHVFPKAVLVDAGYPQKQRNAVANFAFLTGETNRKLGKRFPADYFAEVDGKHPGALASQWITDDRSLWEPERYLDFLADRRIRLAAATNALLGSLRSGTVPDTVRGTSGGVSETSEEHSLEALSDWCDGLGLARPEIAAEIADPDSGEALVYPDAAWPDGLQVGLTEKIALVLDQDPETEARLSELGYRFFTSQGAFRHHVEELLNLDLDGDGVVGPVQTTSATPQPPRAGTGRTWYVNYGDNLQRDWDDARRYGFVSAGGGNWYSKALRRLAPGDTLLVYLPGRGYAGVATATRRAAPIHEAIVDIGGIPTSFQTLDLHAPYTHADESEDGLEWVVSVHWQAVVDKSEALREPGLFANQATAVEMRLDNERHMETVTSVMGHYGIDPTPPSSVD